LAQASRAIRLSSAQGPVMTTLDFPQPQESVFAGSSSVCKGSATRLYEWQLEELLGSGAYAKVYKGKLQGSDTMVAIKVIDKSHQHASCALGEHAWRYREALLRLDHPNTIAFFDFIEEERELYVAMELCDGGDFFDFMCQLTSFTEADCAGWTKQVLTALAYVHGQGICHRDVKPENLRWSHEGEGAVLKLVDFGLATLDLEQRCLVEAEVVGTTLYAAPEVLDGSYNMQCDTWGVGVALVLLITGKFPFVFEGAHPVYRGKRYKLDDPAWEPVSPECRAMVLALLNPDPWTRVSPVEALARRWTGLVQQVVVTHPTAERLASLAVSRKQSCMGVDGTLWDVDGEEDGGDVYGA